MSEMMIQSSTFGIADPAAIAAAERVKAIVLAKFMMAERKPRDMARSRERILETCKRLEFAEKAEYVLPIGGKKIRGPSIRLAETVIQSVGNIDVSTSVVFEDDMNRRIRVEVTDLESNATYSDEVTISKTVERREPKESDTILRKRQNSTGQTVYTIAATDADLAKKENAAKSKIIRNQGLRLVPEDVISEAVDMCRRTIAGGGGASLIDRRKNLLDKFRTVGVTAEMLVAYTRKPIDSLIETDITDLIPVFNALRDGHSEWKDFMPESSESKSSQSMAEKAKEKMKPKPESKETPVEQETIDAESQDSTPDDDMPDRFQQAKYKLDKANTIEQLNAANTWYTKYTSSGTGEITDDEWTQLTDRYNERKKQISGRGA